MRIISRLIAFTIVLLSHSLVAAEPPTGLNEARLDRIDRLAGEYISENRIPGAVYAVQRRGETARLSAMGQMREDSLFRIYSMTKPVATVAVLILYEEGAFLLSDPLSRYLPEFSDMQVWSEGGKLTPASRPMTIEHLLTHTAGLSYDFFGGEGVPALYAEAELWTVDSLAEFSRRVATLPLMFDPGSRWHYSVANDIQGRLVEVVSGQPFDEFVQERILQPLGMIDSGFSVPPDKASRLLPLYQRDGEGMKLFEAPEDSDLLKPSPVPFGGSGMVSTARDYLRFCQMLLNGGQLDGARILGRKTVDLMMMNHLGPEHGTPALPDPWMSLTENRSGDLDLGLGFGYGGYVITDVARNAVPGSTGTYSWGGAASTYFFIDPQEELIGVFLTQLMPSTSYPIRSQFRGLVYQALVD